MATFKANLGAATEGDASAGMIRTTPYSWYVATLICLASIMSVLDRYLFGVTLEPVKHELSLSDSQLAIVQGPAFVALFLFTSIPAGRLADIGNRRLIIVIALALWSIATAATAFAQSFVWLLVTRMAVGLGEAMLLPSAMSLIAAYFSEDKLSRATAFYTVGGPLGKAFAFIGGGAVIAAFQATGGANLFGFHASPWRLTFLLAGMMGMVSSLLFVLTVREPARVERQRRAGQGIGASFAYLLRHRTGFLAIFIPFAMYTAITYQMASWSVSFYVREHGLTVSDAAAIIGFTGLAVGPLGQIVGGVGGDYMRKRGMRGLHAYLLAAGLLGALVFTIIFALSPTVLLAGLAFAIAQFLLNCGGPIAYTAVQLATPDQHRGTVSSMFLLTFTLLGTGLGPLLIALVNDYVFVSEKMMSASVIVSSSLLAGVGIVTALCARRAYLRLLDERGSAGPAPE